MYWKRLRVDREKLALLALIVVALLIRLALITLRWPATNSDEATIDLMALHIFQGKELPVFFYGQSYMGAFEAYIGALCFHLFGVSVSSLRFGLLPLFAIFLICTYILIKKLYGSTAFALFSLAILSLGSNDIIMHQLKAIGGYPETLMFSAIIFLLAYSLASTSHPWQHELSAQQQRKRSWLYGLLGLCTGFALYTDPLIFPQLLTAWLGLIIFCRRELRSWPLLWVLLGFCLGISPAVIDGIRAGPNNTMINAIINIQRSGAEQLAQQHLTFIHQLIGALLISFPTATGLNPACQASDFPYFGPGTAGTTTCLLVHGSWAAGYLMLWTLALAQIARPLWHAFHTRQWRTWTIEERQASVNLSFRLLLLLSAMFSLLLYVFKPEAALAPLPTTRYLMCMLLTLPVLLWPLWNGLQRGSFKLQRVSLMRAGSLGLIALLAFVGTMYLFGTARIFQDEVIPAQNFAYQQDDLVHNLLNIGATRIYSDYWTCNRIIFASKEQIICATLDPQLHPGQDRYLPYRTMVAAVSHPTYIFPLHGNGSDQIHTLEQQLQQQNIPYQRFIMHGYAIYQAERHVDT